MSTIDRPVASAPTPVEQLPPLTVVTDGIPASEHLTPAAAPDTLALDPGERHDWAFRLGIVALVVLVLGKLGYGVWTILAPPPSTARMGLSAQEWSSYRAGERVVGASVAVAPPTISTFTLGDPFARSPG